MINLKIARIRKGLTQKQLADIIGVSSNCDIARYESGKVSPPIPKLIAMADALEVTTDYLLGRTKED